MSEDHFVDRVAEGLAALPTVDAVALGGSRAVGTERPDSDWDFAVYYRGAFKPQDLRDIGWPGEISEIGGWGGGVFNGGAWLTIDGQKVDVHYRDLDTVEHELAEVRAGRFRIEPLLFHLAGIPTYLVAAELALNRVLRGQLPRPTYPEALRRAAPTVWRGRADLLFDYARTQHAVSGRLSQCLGLVVQAASCSAHAVLAERGEWITNEKLLLARAGLAGLDRIFGGATPDPIALQRVVDESRDLCARISGESAPGLRPS